MKLVLGWLASWGLYWLGDIVSRPMIRFDMRSLYTVYHRIMSASIDVQDWGGAGPWKTVTEAP